MMPHRLVNFLLLIIGVFIASASFGQIDNDSITKKKTRISFLEALITGSTYESPLKINDNTKGPNIGGITGGIRFGTSWLFGQRDRYKYGLQVVWARVEFGYGDGVVMLGSPLNVGLTNVWNKSKDIGCELNLNTGLTVFSVSDLFTSKEAVGISVNPEFKIRSKSLLIGLGYGYMFGQMNSNPIGNIHRHSLTFSIGKQLSKRKPKPPRIVEEKANTNVPLENVDANADLSLVIALKGHRGKRLIHNDKRIHVYYKDHLNRIQRASGALKIIDQAHVMVGEKYFHINQLIIKIRLPKSYSLDKYTLRIIKNSDSN